MGVVVRTANSREHKLPYTEIMSVVQPAPRRPSYSTSVSAEDRKPSLRELPSYKDEAKRALHRQDDLKSLSKRLSSNRDLLNADPSTKPWLKFRSISRTDNLAKVREDASQAFPLEEGTFTATPAKVMTSDDLSQSTSSEQSETETTLNDSYDD